MSNKALSLAAKAQQGDKNAFAEIYEQYLNKIYRFVYYLVYESEVAEDICQETFLKAWKALPRFSSARGTMQSFLYTIARNLVIDYQRKKKEYPLESAQEMASREDPVEDTERKEEQNMVHKALSQLEFLDRQILMLYYFEEMPSADIAQVVGKSPGAVRVAIHRALGKVKEKLGGDNG